MEPVSTVSETVLFRTKLDRCSVRSGFTPVCKCYRKRGSFQHSPIDFGCIYLTRTVLCFLRHTVMGDFWSFNFTSHSWTKLESYPVPPLAAHTATLVGEKMFIVGGFSKNGSPSSSMYVWSATDKKWSIESPRNGEDHLIRVAGHTAVYYAPLSSLIVFGGMRGASTGGQLYMYHVKQKIWTAVGQQFSPNSHPRYTQLVFHTANIVANYMVITGGYDVGNAQSCREGSVYLYHLDCQVFLASGIFEEKNLCKCQAKISCRSFFLRLRLAWQSVSSPNSLPA